jgi:hypothetical protein
MELKHINSNSKNVIISSVNHVYFVLKNNVKIEFKYECIINIGFHVCNKNIVITSEYIMLKGFKQRN